ncbi:MAG: DinB family protein [Ginsengibacter sp.]
MEKSIQTLKSILANYPDSLNNLTEKQWMYKSNPAKWSKKEVLGHLIDSTQNNIRRFVVAQYDDKLKITYVQDFWVAAANYQNYFTPDLISLWILLNKHLCIVLKNIPGDSGETLCNVGEIRTIVWLAQDYCKHLLHHLHQILDMEPVAYP